MTNVRWNGHARSLVAAALATFLLAAGMVLSAGLEGTISAEAGASFFPLTPARLLDTRSSEKVGAADGNGVPLSLIVSGQGGLPDSGVGAVVLNVTVTLTEDPTVGGGYVTVYPCGTRPNASNLNFVGGQTTANTVIAPVNQAGEVCFYVYGTAHLLADVSGYFPTNSGFAALPPDRLLDTRSGAKVGAADGNGAPLVLNVFGKGWLPDSGLDAVALNVTVTGTEDPTVGGGYVTVYPCGTRPNASNLNFVGGQTIPNTVIAPVSAAGEVCFYVYGTAHLLADVSGYFPAGSGFTSLPPARLLDTRSGSKVGAADGNGAPLVLNVFGKAGLPGSGIGAVALNVTVTGTEDPRVGGGYVTVYPCGTRPNASNVNFVGGQTIPNTVIAPVNQAGEVCLYVYGTAHLLADVSGYLPGPGLPVITTPVTLPHNFRLCTTSGTGDSEYDVLFASADGIEVLVSFYWPDPTPSGSCLGPIKYQSTMYVAATQPVAQALCRADFTWERLVSASSFTGAVQQHPNNLWQCDTYLLAEHVLVNGFVDCAGDFSGTYQVFRGDSPSSTVALTVDLRIVGTVDGKTYFNSVVPSPSSGSLLNDSPGTGDADPTLNYELVVDIGSGLQVVVDVVEATFCT